MKTTRLDDRYPKGRQVYIRPDVHRALKRMAVEQDTSLVELATRAICLGIGRPDLLEPTEAEAEALASA